MEDDYDFFQALLMLLAYVLAIVFSVQTCKEMKIKDNIRKECLHQILEKGYSESEVKRFCEIQNIGSRDIDYCRLLDNRRVMTDLEKYVKGEIPNAVEDKNE